MNKSDESSGAQPASVEAVEVRATIEQARQALEASRTEIERSKRLLRETEELVDVSSPPTAKQSSNGTGSG